MVELTRLGWASVVVVAFELVVIVAVVSVSAWATAAVVAAVKAAAAMRVPIILCLRRPCKTLHLPSPKAA